MPTIEEFGAIMGELEIDNLVFLTIGGDFLSLLQVVLGVPLAMQIGGASLANLTLAWSIL